MSKRQMVKQSRRTRRTFSSEFKIRAVKMVTEQGYKIDEAARQLEKQRCQEPFISFLAILFCFNFVFLFCSPCFWCNYTKNGS